MTMINSTVLHTWTFFKTVVCQDYLNKPGRKVGPFKYHYYVNPIIGSSYEWKLVEYFKEHIWKAIKQSKKKKKGNSVFILNSFIFLYHLTLFNT